MGKLTDIQIRDWIKRGERFEGRGDGEGLYLRFRKIDAVPSWLFRYRCNGKARMMLLGSYKILSLADARKTAKELRARVALGYDPAGEKQERKREAVRKIEEAKLQITMGQLADEYFAAQILGRWKHPNIVRSRIDNDIKPNIGKLPIGDVKPQHIDAMLKEIVKRGAPTMAILENRPRRNGWLIAGPSLREKKLPHMPCSASGMTGTGLRSRMRAVPGRNG